MQASALISINEFVQAAHKIKHKVTCEGNVNTKVEAEVRLHGHSNIGPDHVVNKLEDFGWKIVSTEDLADRVCDNNNRHRIIYVDGVPVGCEIVHKRSVGKRNKWQFGNWLATASVSLEEENVEKLSTETKHVKLMRRIRLQQPKSSAVCVDVSQVRMGKTFHEALQCHPHTETEIELDVNSDADALAAQAGLCDAISVVTCVCV
jgi:hypothetical protein